MAHVWLATTVWQTTITTKDIQLHLSLQDEMTRHLPQALCHGENEMRTILTIPDAQTHHLKRHTNYSKTRTPAIILT